MARPGRDEEEVATFLDPLPQPWAMRGLATLLIAVCVALIVAAAVIQLPETVTSPFVLVPVHGADPVRASRDGVVEGVQALAGQPVLKGDLLFTLLSESVCDRTSELQTQLSERDGAREALANAMESYVSRRAADAGELRKLEDRAESFRRQVAVRREEYELTLDVESRYESLAELGLVSETLLASHQLNERQARRDLEAQESSLAESRAALEKLRFEIEVSEVDQGETERELREEAARAEIRIAALQLQHRAGDGSTLSIPAPCNGTVLRVEVQAIGTFVQEGEVLGELACSDEPLQAQLEIPQGDVALLEPGLGIKLLYDAFPYQRHGVRFATLRWVSPASVEIDGQPVFRALADVVETEVFVKGKPRPIKAGMRGDARIVIGRRTLLSYAFEPIQRLRESLTDAPAS